MWQSLSRENFTDPKCIHGRCYSHGFLSQHRNLESFIRIYSDVGMFSYRALQEKALILCKVLSLCSAVRITAVFTFHYLDCVKEFKLLSKMFLSFYREFIYYLN